MGQNLAPMLLMDTVTIPTSQNLDLLKMLGTGKTKSRKWWFDGDLPWYKVKETFNTSKTISTFLLFHDPNGFLRWRSLSDRINGPHQWNDPHWRYLSITISISFTRKNWINVHCYPRLWNGKCISHNYIPCKSSLALVPGWCFFPNASQKALVKSK